MLTLRFDHPLTYPKTHTPRAQNARGYDNGFPPDISIEESLEYLQQELESLNADSACISSNFKHIGNPRLREQSNKDTGCMLTFSRNKVQYEMISDHWALFAHNLYAAHLLIRHVRNVEKWGVGTIEKALYGYISGTQVASAQPEATTDWQETLPDWMITLGLGPTSTLEDANTLYRKRAKETGENTEKLIALNGAIEEARKALQ